MTESHSDPISSAPLSGADLQKLNEDTFKASPQAIETARQIMEP